MKASLYTRLLTLLLLFCTSYVHAQFSFTGQLRTRTEYREGAGNLMPIGNHPALFTSQRTNLNFGYKWDKLIFCAQIRDVRVWGQDASTINNVDGNRLFVHEAWGEIIFANAADSTSRLKLDNLSLKIGRQEISYDDQRLLGSLDWLQQGRRHDAAILKFMHHGYQADLGVAFNQNTDAFGKNGVFYSPVSTSAYATTTTGFLIPVPGTKATFVPTNGKNGAPVVSGAIASTNGMNQMYKTMQFLYLKKKFGQTSVSGLLFVDNFAKWRLDSIGNVTTGYAYGRNYDQTGVNTRLTYGVNVNTVLGKADASSKWMLQGLAYMQSGKDANGIDLSAYYVAANVMYQRGKIAMGPGYEILSGNSSTATSNHRFDPLYGTPHKFWGYMDYFYAGTSSPVQGLQNAVFKTKYSNKKAYITLDVHGFWTAAQGKNTFTSEDLDKYLGTECDLVLNYTLSKLVSLEAGYSVMFATNSMEYVKSQAVGVPTQGKTQHNAQWAYLMINIRPDFLAKSSTATK